MQPQMVAKSEIADLRVERAEDLLRTRSFESSSPQALLRWDVGEPAIETRLNSYLVHHNEFLDRGMLPYARIVSYDATR